mmetsp:Transcript_23365/g.32640  ORF Transcript_23365/g.32640 Transcript_23365/m.32640 type:complete len:205 (-) Transcript_23365:263-877(-)
MAPIKTKKNVFEMYCGPHCYCCSLRYEWHPLNHFSSTLKNPLVMLQFLHGLRLSSCYAHHFAAAAVSWMLPNQDFALPLFVEFVPHQIHTVLNDAQIDYNFLRRKNHDCTVGIQNNQLPWLFHLWGKNTTFPQVVRMIDHDTHQFQQHVHLYDGSVVYDGECDRYLIIVVRKIQESFRVRHTCRQLGCFRMPRIHVIVLVPAEE